MKGKTQESAFLNERELLEFNSNFKVPRSAHPLLPQSIFVSLKSDEHIQNEQDNTNVTSNEVAPSLEPRLSLSKWMLWQTTPQRTHMVSHSSRSQLLIQTTEKINFRDAANQTYGEQNTSIFARPNTPNPISAKNAGQLSDETLNPPVVNLCSDDEFGEFDIMEIVPTQEIVRKEGIVNDSSFFLSKQLSDRISLLPIAQEGNLLKRLFGIESLNIPCKSSSCIPKPPPLVSDSLSLESFSNVLIEPEPLIESKNCTLRILNNKMRARLKRKSGELGIKLSFSFVEGRVDTPIKENKPLESSLLAQSKAKTSTACFDVSFHCISPVEDIKPKCDDNLDQTLVPKAITFDIDFDIPEAFEEKFSDEVDNVVCSPNQRETIKDVPETREKHDQEFGSFDGDSSLIFEQFFSNKDDDIADKLEESFCSPLMIKKVVFESDSSRTQGVQKRTPKTNNLNLHKHSLSSIKRKRAEKKNTESTQYGLTQLVSLIDNTEYGAKNVDETEDFKMALNVTHNEDDENGSSDEEIEPTPPKEIIPVASKFCYRSNSVNFDSDILQKDGKKNELKAPLSPVALNSKISFDLTFTPSKSEDKKLAGTSKVQHSVQDKVNSAPSLINVNRPTHFSKGISFDLSDIPYSPEGTCDAILDKRDKINDFNRNITSNSSIQIVTPNPDKINPKILFDLSEVPFSPLEKLDEKNKTCVEQGDSFYIKDSLENSEQNVLNRRISSSPTKFETNLSFDLSDIQFSQEEKFPIKDIKRNFPQRKLNANLEQQNTNISFDLSDEQFSYDNKNINNVTNVSEIRKPEKVNNSEEKAKPSFSKKICDPSTSANTVVSFDLSDVQFPGQINKDYDAKESKEDNYIEDIDPIASFESETYDKVFFDISFDFPDLKTETAVPKSKKISAETPSNNSVLRNESATKADNSVIPQTSLSKKSSSTHNSVSNTLENVNVLQKSEYLNASKPSTSNFQFRKQESLIPRELFIPLKSNTNTNSDKNLSVNHISDLSLLQESPESPNVFALGRKRKRHNVLDDSTLASTCAPNTEVDDFIQPANKDNSSEVIQNKKKRMNKKGRSKNKFLLTQADVSGPESSGDEIDEDEDVMEESFINDNTFHESPLNQRAMYLQSVKNIVGRPQKFKLKERSYRSDHQVCSQPIDEGCSDYMLDSFCVDDEEVVFTSSSDEVEKSIENHRAKINNRKRKRIIDLNDTSSSEEEFVKKINSPEDEGIFVRKLTPESNFLNKANSSKVHKKTNLVIDEDNVERTTLKHIGKPKDRTAIVPELKSVHKISIPSCSKFTFKPSSSNIQEPIPAKNNFYETNVESVSEPAKLPNPFQRQDLVFENSKVNPQPTDDFLDMAKYDNFSFDVGWDDVDPEPMIIDNASNLQKTNAESNFQTIASTSTTTASHTNQSQCKVSEDVFSMDIPNRKCSTQIISCLNSSVNDTACIKTILVDSRELASGKPVISALRNKHGVNPFVMQLVSADYILSNKVAVERVVDSDFPSFGLPIKLVEKVRTMNELYEKSIVIIEKDSRKKAMGFNKSSTKYLQFAVYANLHPTISVMYSNSVDDTASIIYDIIEKERKKGLHIDVPVSLNPSSQKLYDFYLSLPHVSPICAFNFVYRFPSVKLFCSSSVDQLKKAGFISTRKATAVLHFISSELLIASFS